MFKVQSPILYLFSFTITKQKLPLERIRNNILHCWINSLYVTLYNYNENKNIRKSVIIRNSLYAKKKVSSINLLNIIIAKVLSIFKNILLRIVLFTFSSISIQSVQRFRNLDVLQNTIV